MFRRSSAAAVGLLVLSVVSTGAPASAQAATASISGTVTATEGGAPVVGLCVQALGFAFTEGDGGQIEREVVTDAAGRYSITGLPESFVVVGFNTCATPDPAFAAEYYRDERSQFEADEIIVDPGEQVVAIDASLERGARISGRLTDAVGTAGVAGITVVTFEEDTGATARAVSAVDGTYSLVALPAGSYFVVFEDMSEPRTFVPEVFRDRSAFDPEVQPEPVVLTAGEQRTAVDAALEEGGAIRGRLTAEHTGEAADLCAVVALLANDTESPRGAGFTGFEEGLPPGEYIAGGIPVGEYVLEIDCFGGFEVEFYDDALDPASADRVQVQRGQVTTGIDAVLTPAPSIDFACGLSGQFPGEPSSTEQFRDVPDDNVHADAILCVAALDIARGRSDGTYGPSLPVRRDQLASFVTRALEAMGLELPADPPDRFTDDETSVHELEVNQLAELGIVSGRSPGRFAPGEPVSRGQMATILVGAYEEVTGFTLRSSGDRFTDDEASVHEANIDKAATAALTTGRTATTYEPDGNVRRDQLATFLARSIDRVLRDTFTLPGATPTTTADPPAFQPAARSAWLRRQVGG